MDINRTLAQEFGLRQEQVDNTVALIDDDEPEIIREPRAVLRFDIDNLRGVSCSLAGPLRWLLLFLL